LGSYLRPTGPIAEDVLLASDPAACMSLAQLLVTRPLMANHSYGLWGYSGETAGGRALTIHSTGIGAPSAATVLGELASHGARRAIRVAALPAGAGARVGERFVVSSARALDGTSRALGSGELAHPDPALTARLLATAGPDAREGRISSSDPGRTPAAGGIGELNGNSVAADLETAALFAAGRTYGVATAAAFVAGPAAGSDGVLPPGLAELAAACVAAFEGF